MRTSPAQGLYSPAFERDSCGFGLVARLDDAPSRALVDAALVALDRLTHRGAVAADGRSGDGCGLLLRRPQAFLAAIAAEAGLAFGPGDACGMVFLPDDDARADAGRAALDAALTAQGLGVSGWRTVPMAQAACGPVARAGMPRVAQVFVRAPPGGDGADFSRRLFLARRAAEQARAQDPDFYVASLSPATLAYKAMVLPSALPALYPDLARPELASSAVLFHQRFSTNTAPAWKLAQPFRLLAHNGEINTITGNRSWARARAAHWRTPHFDLAALQPLVAMEGSDSQSLDNLLELLLAGGMDLLQAIRILVPPATSSLEYKDPDLAAFYEYHGLSSDPWDGPAGIVMCDARYAACTLDRNGLRPARWLLTDDGLLVVASEAGVVDVDEARVAARGRLGPGEMLAVDFERGRMLGSEDIDAINKARAPYKAWLKQGVEYLGTSLVDPSLAAEPFDAPTLRRFQVLFQLTREEREAELRVLAETEQEATGSMGDDTPLAVMSHQIRPVHDYFRQAFAQVTNPPIDPIREQVVMSLATQMGPEGNVFDDGPDNAVQVLLNSPLLSQRKLRQLLAMPRFAGAHALLHLHLRADETLEAALRRLQAEAETAVRDGAAIVMLSDRYPEPGGAVVPALLATGAVHHHLIDAGLRCRANLVVETGAARGAHAIACLIGAGATAVYPYLAYQTIAALGRAGVVDGKIGNAPAELGRSYRRGIKKGLLKILSKMGISTIASYRGAMLFEIVGLAREVVDVCFPGAVSRIEGAGFAELEAEARELAAQAWSPAPELAPGGRHKLVVGGESHMFNPDVINSLQRAVRSGDEADYRAYAAHVDGRAPSALRDLLRLRVDEAPIPLEAVEPEEAILARFDSAGMSLGALSPEAHEALAIAMNRLGGRSNSGEGGEDPARHGTEKRSKIKQVASGRFGVTPGYLVNAEVLQIKIAQGAKPGEGGQLPGHKVNAMIAALRHARPGIGLISPPPHHDIYSIEDLAQLVFDLKQVNPDALVSVKLVSHAGVGTIAAGVAKAYADLVTISGHDGGTGASPLSSIHHAGTPWELGLSEVQQTLRRNGLRGRVRVQVDGGLKTGLDVVKAAILGAESFGFGTTPMVALGCRYLRICHLNNCATGVATQDPRLRANHFTGLPGMAMNFFRFVAGDVRQWLARLGVARLEDLIGRTDLLEILPGDTPRQRRLDLRPILDAARGEGEAPRHVLDARNPPRDAAVLATRMLAETRAAIHAGAGGEFGFSVNNRDRSLGTLLSGEIARVHGDAGLPEAPLHLRLRGVAGQSLGAFNAAGLHLTLDGEANDYVGKGMAGGRLVLRPAPGLRQPAHEAPIMGNTCLYGATGGELFAAGRAGERFAVRNSGALAVVEGVGEHGCEYMTGGVVAVLGRTGLNFGAGLTGGIAYVLDLDRDFVDRYNHELIDVHRITPEGMEHHRHHLRGLLREHVAHTGSTWGARLLEDFRDVAGRFWLVKPKAASLEQLADELRRAA
ncbi:MAG: glutamate synthase large subunit [Arenimonas sp. SCN 70-307]|uniref:glutamate synthase large subunit n=1 Tax=Arenimonas sp. SCN 70-307 TaxID=1660089 RepID=UPI000868DD49|nr:glutamate synthase large subunit [Arenimonas sp. SCN 70-307]ODS64352.1 MAG: glutamate synthase large subunit [Arenimonas sp. SCN 70-307]